MEKPLQLHSPPPLPEGGTVGQVLKKTANGVEWGNDAVGVTAQQLENQRVSLQNQINAINNNMVGSSGYRIINGTLICWGSVQFGGAVNFARPFSSTPLSIVNCPSAFGDNINKYDQSVRPLSITTTYISLNGAARYIAIGNA